MPDNQNRTPPPPATGGEDKTVAVVAYLSLIGFVAAIIIHRKHKTKLGAFHLRQMLGFILSWLAVVVLIIIPIIGLLAIIVIWLSMLALWITGLMAAINGELKPMPIVGPLYQRWFGTAFDWQLTPAESLPPENRKLTWGIVLGVGGFVLIAHALLVGLWARGHSPNMNLGEMLTKFNSYYLKPPVYNIIMTIVAIAGLAGLCAIAVGIALFIKGLDRTGKN